MRSLKVTRLRISIALAVCFALIAAPRVANAWDGVTTGQIWQIEVGGDGAFSVVLTSGAPLCPSAPSRNTGLVMPSVPGLKNMLAALLLAKAQNLSVTIYANNASPGNPSEWACSIGAIDIR